MTTQDIATRLYEFCKQGKSETAHNELYAYNATSTERNMQHEAETVTGLGAIKEKNKKFLSMVEEMHSAYTNEPRVFGNFIFMEMGLDVTMKGIGRIDMKEMCSYEVKADKIISEHFYY